MPKPPLLTTMFDDDLLQQCCVGMVLGNAISGISIGLSSVMEELSAGEHQAGGAGLGALYHHTPPFSYQQLYSMVCMCSHLCECLLNRTVLYFLSKGRPHMLE